MNKLNDISNLRIKIKLSNNITFEREHLGETKKLLFKHLKS